MTNGAPRSWTLEPPLSRYPRCISRGDTIRCASAIVRLASSSIRAPFACGYNRLIMAVTSAWVRSLMAACRSRRLFLFVFVIRTEFCHTSHNTLNAV